MIRSICTTLFISLFVIYPVSPSNAATTISKTVTIKGSNNALYSGAQVGVVYFIDGASEEVFQSLQISSANGQVTISYPSNASYAQMFITPPEADTTNAVKTIDLLTSTDTVIANVTLAASNIRIKPQTPSGGDAGLHTCIDYPKVASSRWVTTQYRTTRTGAFGLAIPSTLNPLRDYHIGLSPCNKSDYKYQAKNFGLRRASNGSITLYTDETFKTAATATSGVYLLKFDQGKVRGQILDSNGNTFTTVSGTYIYLRAVPIFSDGTSDAGRNDVWADQLTPDNQFSFNSGFDTGRYRIYVASYGDNPITSFVGGDIWVDSALKYSTSETGTFTSTLDVNYRLPSSGITKFALVNDSGQVQQTGGFIRLTQAGVSDKREAMVLNTNDLGLASGQIPDGSYALTGTMKNSYGLNANFTLNVSGGVVTLRNAQNQIISKVGDYYPLAVGSANLSIRMVSPSDTSIAMVSTEGALLDSTQSNELGYFWNETNTSVSKLKITPGSYAFRVSSYSQAEALSTNIYTIDVDSTSVVIKSGTTVIQPVNGIYLLSPKRPTITGSVFNPSGTEAMRFVEVRARHATNPKLSFNASTNSAGDFAMDFGTPPADGIYYLTATPQIGVNANYGVSDSVTVIVTGGVPNVSTVSIRLRTANVSGVVSGPNGPAPQNWLTVQESRTGVYLDPTIDGPLTDEDGGYSLYLPTGAYGITPSSDYGNTGGVANGPKTCAVGSNPASAVTCNISLVAPNVTGTITIAGEKPLQSMVGFAPQSSDPTALKSFAGKYGGTLWSNWSDINNYGIKIESGTYRLWIAYQTYTNEQTTLPGPLCVVPETGTVVCDATLSAANLKIQFADWNGNAIRGNVSAAIQYKESSSYFWTCCANSDPTLKDGKLQVGLINGSYKILLNSSENLGDGVAQTYFFDVSGGVVSNMRLTESGTVITATAGLYTLRLKEPVISGVLYAPNGTTPKPYTDIRIYNSSGGEIGATQSDRLGRFAFEFEAPLVNGTYSIMAMPRQSLTEGNSKLETFTVSNGKATSSISLKLNAPNVVGTASGPLGVSRNTFIRVQSSSAGSAVSGKFVYTFSDQDGKFAFYLPTGTYSFWGDTNFEVTGGVQGASSPCTVNAESSTVITCNLTFAAPNVSGTITNNGVAARDSYVLFFPAYGIAGNTATNSYGWIYASSGKYGVVANPGTYRTYTVNNSNSKLGWNVIPGPLCVVPTSGSVTCNIARGAPNFTYKAKSPNGSDLSNDYGSTMEVKNGDQYQSAGQIWQSGGTPNSIFLFDGSYRLQIDPSNPVTDGSSAAFTFDVVSGVVTNLQKTDSTTVLTPVGGVYQLSTATPNIVGTVTGIKGAAANVWIEINQITTNGKGQYFSTSTDSSGRFALRLPVGIYSVKARPDFATTGGGDTTVRCEIISETASAITCNIALVAPNVTGTVKIAGSVPQWGSVTLRPANGIAGNTATETYWWSQLYNGVYGVNAKPGTYRMIYSLPSNVSSQMTSGGLCIVPETGTVVCDGNLPAPNFTMNVLSATGSVLSSAAIEAGPLNGEIWDSLCCDNIDSNSKQKSYSLIDGRYRIRVFLWNSGGSQTYLLTIETGTVKSLRALGSTTEIVASNGIYSLRLKPPTFSGTVYRPNGTTPAAGIYVLGESSRGGWGAWTDADGKFSIDVDSTITDASFTFSARPNRLLYQAGSTVDSAVASSATKVESLTAGVGSQSISLVLRAPNITGRVTGPKGPLANRDLAFQKLDGAGNWNWVGTQTYADSNGNFVEYLSSGTYRLYSWGDMKGAGGGETYGNPCVINAESATATTCNMVLSAPNVTGTIRYNGVVISRGDLQFQPDPSSPTFNKSGRYYYTSVEQGLYGNTMQADTYRISIGFNVNGKYIRVLGPKCVVPESGTVTCDINFPAINLTYKVLDSSDALLTSNVYSSLEIKSGENWVWTCCSNPDSYLNDGKFEATLIDGSYRLGVRPGNASIAGSTQNYTFTVESGTVKNFSKEGAIETITAVAGVYTTKLRLAAVTGTVYKLDGTTVYSNARVCARPSDQNGTYWRICSYTNSAGKFTFDQNYISDATWMVQAFATSDDLTQGSSIQDSVTVTFGIGSKVLTLVTRAPTVTGTVTGPNGASPNNYINVRKYYDNGNYDYLDMYFITDSQGRFAFTLEPGRYKIVAQNDMAIAGGTSAMSSDCIVTSGPVTCNVALQAPNFTGTVSIAGVGVQASIELLRETTFGYEYLGLSAGTNQTGAYWMTVTPGTYRTRIYLYNSGTWIIGPSCLVQSGSATTCNIALPATNFQFKVNKASGAVATSGVYAYVEYINGDRRLWGGIGSSDASGIFKNSFIDGQYRLVVGPNGNDATIGTASVYTLRIESGTVTSLTREGSATQLTTTSNIFTLALGVPTISGTVVAPDGTTPIPNARVYAFNNPWWGYRSDADQNANYGFTQLPDGTYSMIAAPAYGDATKAPSLPAKVTVTNGVGANDLKLTLRSPNVTGVVRGSTGKVSQYNWISVEQKMNGGWWQRPDYFIDNLTSTEGSFAFYLEPGIYRIRANGDMNGAGGVASVVICTVPSSGSVTCNITLKSPNFKVRVVAPNTTTYNKGSWAWTYLQSTTNEDAITNRNPNFEWDQNGNYQTVLEDGTWVVRTEGGENTNYSNTQFTVEVSGGAVTKVINAKGETLTAVAGTYMLPLIESNLRGTISFNGVQFQGGASVQVLRQEGDYWYYYTGKWSSTGDFGFTVPAGNYKVEVVPYWNVQNISVATTKSALCVVDVTGTTTCDVALRAPNLRGKIVDKFGAAFRFADAYMLLQQNKGEQWLRWLNLTDGVFETYLEDGSYRIQVMPRWEYRATYTDRSYIIKVESGTVTSVIEQSNSTPISATNGAYSFALGTPSVTGKVYNPDRATSAPYVSIQVAPSSSPKWWRYSAQADSNGNFALTVPDGTYVVQAVPNNGGFQYGKSETKTVVVSGGLLSGMDSVTLVLRNPNLIGRVVTPGGSPQPLANVNVNIYIDGENFYGWTDSDGRFSAYVDNPAPNCPSRCSINLNYYKSSEYTPKYYSVSTITNLGDLAIGGVTTKLTVKVPQVGGADLPSKYSWVSVERVANDGSRSWVTSGSTNENGVVGLSLEAGNKYWIWAYPNGEQSNGFAPKKLEILNYSVETHAVLSLTFDMPNVKLKVVTATDGENVYGWYTVSTWDSATSTATQISNASLDSKGLSALTLANGDYQLRFWPGQGARGVQKTAIIRVSGSTITWVSGNVAGADSITSSLVTLKLGSGNISGYIQNSSAAAYASALVAAYRVDDPTKFITTSSDANGYYQLNLDLTYSWDVKSVDPVSGNAGTLRIASRSPSNSVLSNQNVTLVPVP